MIPGVTDERTSPGEKEVFNLIAAGNDDWTILYALDLAPWNRGLRTEIDFVVLIPATGILCVEVKSQELIRFDGVRWQPKTITRSPFKQAADGRFAFYRGLSRIAPQYSHVPVVHMCIFPRSQFRVAPNLSIHTWESMDSSVFRSIEDGTSFCNELQSRTLKSIDNDPTLQHLQHRLSKTQINSIVNFCLPIHRYRPDLRDVIRQRELEAEQLLTVQQKPVLQLVESNRRVVVSGPAGTGKTLIAMEVARRIAQTGRRVALLCYNQLIGDWMKLNVSESQFSTPSLIVGRAIQIMATMAEIPIPKSPSADFWSVELPTQLEERLTDPDFTLVANFDYLVVDEAQDLMARPNLWQCLSKFLVGEMTNGEFAIFGDFEHQILSNRSFVQDAMAELNLQSNPAHWKLTENCRNYRVVGDTAVRLSGITDNVYTEYLRIGGSIQNYDIFFYDDDKIQDERLKQWIDELRLLGYRPNEITLLSLRTDGESSAERLIRKGERLEPKWKNNSKSISYSSIQAFKGMENKVVILTDIALGDKDFHRTLFYTGMTRGTEVVRVLCEEKSQTSILNWISNRKRS